jgi:hypothetical protein
MTPAPMIIPPQAAGAPGVGVRGASLVIEDWSAQGEAHEVAPLHVHRADDVITAGAGSTVLVPAGVAHTFGNAGPQPSRYLIILPARLDELIKRLHEAEPAEHPAIYRSFESELLE